MVIYQYNNPNSYDLKLIVDLFYTSSQVVYTEDKETFFSLDHHEYGISVGSVEENELTIALYELKSGKVLAERTLFVLEEGFKNAYKRILYQYLEKTTEPLTKWGILVGIRPVKIIHECLDKGDSIEQIREFMRTEYLVAPEKIDLMIETAMKERPYLYPIDSNLVSLYLCIPFCPTRCLYCSFPSNEIQKKGKYLPQYLELLIDELRFALKEIERAGKIVDCIYIGGGTPTTLDAVQLEKLLSEIHGLIPGDQVKEFSVEAGRPDTIDLDKLMVMKKYGVDRICINPQTMNDQTLITIGRSHDATSTRDVMNMAKSVGFKSINMDVIMGLPGESTGDASRTLSSLIEMDPENITVHTLAVKRASTLNANKEEIELAHDKVVSDMLEHGDSLLRAAGLTPYYMYRQKKMIGHLENIGYAKAGYESLYNMRIMEEKYTIVALGAGAVSKICFPDENRHERVANFKGIEDYINRFEEILDKKKAINEIK